MMTITRQALTDGSGRWFNVDSAKCFSESTVWNGNNHISVPTGSQWNHEELYHTKGGVWVLHSWSQWQGSIAQWEQVGADEAVAWLSSNGHAPQELARSIEALEV